MILLLFSTFLFGIHRSNGDEDCDWTVDPGGFKFNLQDIKGQVLAINASKWTYYYSPCKNALKCDVSKTFKKNVMADQINIETLACTSYLAQKNDSVLPKYEDHAYVFTYNNGQAG